MAEGAIDAQTSYPPSTIAGYDGTSGLTLGGNPDQPSRPAFAGLLEDVAVYGAALTPKRIEAHYQASASGCVPIGPTGDGGIDGGRGDGGPRDAGVPGDGGVDAGTAEDGGPDAGWEDAGEDGGILDGGSLDGGP